MASVRLDTAFSALIGVGTSDAAFSTRAWSFSADFQVNVQNRER
jgi:hypothetical protein